MAAIDASMALLQGLISGDAYGIELTDKIKEKSRGSVKISPGAAYVALRQMEAEGLVESYMGDEPIPERGGKPRRYFKLTAKGKKVAMEDRVNIGGIFDLVPAKVRAMILAFSNPGVTS